MDHTVQIKALRDTAARLVSLGTDAAKHAADAHTAAANLYERGDTHAAEIATVACARAFEALSNAEIRAMNRARYRAHGAPQTNPCVDTAALFASAAGRRA